jgi:hypothetical protein
VDRFYVGNRIDLARDMDDILVLEAPDHVRNRVALPDIGEKLVAQALALRRARHESRDVHELDHRGDDFLGRD